MTDRDGLAGGKHSGKHTSHAETTRIQTERLASFMPREEARRVAERQADTIHRKLDAKASDRSR